MEQNTSGNAICAVDFSNVIGRVKPMHAIGQPPFYCENFSLFSYLQEAHIPFSRLHDVGNWLGGGLYVDIPNLFRDFDADPLDPKAYDFAFTDRLIEQLVAAGVSPIFRLGVSIENSHVLRAYRIFPPRDPYKWARICEGVVRHYNQGFANGYHLGIRYWEIWNEPDDCFVPSESPTWQGSPSDYYRLYEITAKHLRAVFGDTIRIGGYGSCGFYAADGLSDFTNLGLLPTNRMQFFLYFLDGFLRHVRATDSPFDFFSWHTYANTETACRHADACRAILNSYGFSSVETFLDEWNTCFDIRARSSSDAAAQALSMMLAMQNRSPAMLCYYDARIGPSGYGGMFNPDTWEPYKTYYAFRAFGEAYHMGQQAALSLTGGAVRDIYAMGAVDASGCHGLLLFANPSPRPISVQIHAGAFCPRDAVLTDQTHTCEHMSVVSPNGDGVFSCQLSPASCLSLHLSLTDC